MDLPLNYLVLILIAALNLLLGAIIVLKGGVKRENIIFAILLGFVALWVLGLALFGLSDNRAIVTIAAHIFYATASFIPAGIFYFSLTFPSRKLQIHIIREALIVILTAVLLYITLAPQVLIKDVAIYSWGNEVLLGSSYYLYTFIHVLITAWAIINLLLQLKRKELQHIVKIQLKYVLFGIGIAYLFGAIFNLLLPLLGNYKLVWLGPYFLILMAISVTYAIIKHHLLDVRLIATEIFSALIMIVFFVNLLSSDNFSEFILNLMLFVFVVIFSVLLIRGTLREIRELRRLSQAKSEFVSIASHQLRTPLTAIKGFISMIKEGSGTKENRKDWLNKAYISNERLIRIVNDLLNISRIERGKIKYAFKDTDLITLIDDVVEEFQVHIENKNVSLLWEKPEFPIPRVYADPEKLIQVFTNLIDNALKYTDKGRVSIKLTYLKDLKRIRIVVQDTGIGMSKDDLKNIFEIFSRGEGGQKFDTEGTGLGLYVAKEIVKAHRGRMWAESDGLDKGSKFIVELPVQ